jgi:hypothetical protein
VGGAFQSAVAPDLAKNACPALVDHHGRQHFPGRIAAEHEADMRLYPTLLWFITCSLGYNEFDFFLENKEYRPFDGCKIEI